MNRKTMIPLVLTTLLALGPVVSAQGGSTSAPAMPKPAAELSQLKFFAGSLHCKGQAFASPFGPAHATEATVHIALELDGFWYTGRYAEKNTKDNPHPFEVDFAWGHDAAAGKLMATGHDNMGGYFSQASSGWDGDTMVWTGDSFMMGKKSGMRDTFTKKGPNELVHLAEMESNGQWTKLDEETCTRAAAK